MVATVEPLRASYPDVLGTLRRTLEQSRGLLALVVLEVGELTSIEMRSGLEASDAMLARLAARMGESLRFQDWVLRTGDGRFCVLVPGLRNKGHALLACEKLLRLAHEILEQASPAAMPSIHAGVALHPVHAQSAGELLRCAQLASAGARERGERFLVYDDGCALQALRRWELQEYFTNALEGGEIEMHYQPIVRIADRKPAGAEALMRWSRDGRPIASPDVFIPLAEEAGLARATTSYALNVAVREASQWPRTPPGVPPLDVAVNVSAAMLHDPEFNPLVERTLRTWNFPARRLTLEITEGALILDPQEARTRLEALRQLGVRVAIDDFGMGYSSLSYFKQIPADELKIDRSFVTRMLTDVSDMRIVRTVVGLARSFDLSVVAEGVEDEATLLALAEMDCDYAQGYRFAPALPQQKFISWLGAS